MSQTVELPDSVYAALREAAEESGMTPAAWIAARLPEVSTQTGERTDSPSEMLAERFAGRVGHVASGGEGRFSEEGGRKFAEDLEVKRRAGNL